MLGAFQTAVRHWMLRTFGEDIAADATERNWRFLEEALELVQATGCTKEDALQLVDYVYSRAAGVPAQEAGGVLVTLAALANTHDLRLAECARDELFRCWQHIEKIRQKQQTKALRNIGKALP